MQVGKKVAGFGLRVAGWKISYKVAGCKKRFQVAG
jgi:hypothetical protein